MAKPEDKPEPKPEPKKAETPKKPEPPKKPPEKPKEHAKSAPTKMKAAPTKQRDFDPNKIAALLDRREPQRQQVTNTQTPTNAGAGVCQRPVRDGVANRARRIAPSPCAMLEPAGGRGRCGEPEGRVARSIPARRFRRGASGTCRGHAVRLGPGDGGERETRDIELPALHDAQSRQIRAVAGHGNQFRPAAKCWAVDEEKIDRMTKNIFNSLHFETALSRRRLLTAAGGAAAGSLLLPRAAKAVLRLDVTQGTPQPIPIAIPEFLGGQGGGADIGRLVTSASSPMISSARACSCRSTRPPSSSEIQSFDTAPRFQRLAHHQRAGAGDRPRHAPRPTGGFKAEFRLWDVFAGTAAGGQQYFTQPDNWRRIAHIIADAIYERLTGEKGYFDTRIVFVDETGPKERRIKRLAIMDQDGANVRFLTRGRRTGADAALQSVERRKSPTCPTGGRSRGSICCNLETRPARSGRRLPRHDLRAALLAGRPAHRS